MTYDSWKTTEPAPEGIGCLSCRSCEARPGSNYCCDECAAEAGLNSEDTATAT